MKYAKHIAGRDAKKTGATHKDGRVLRVTIYPRAKTKALIVDEARSQKKSLSNYVLLTLLTDIAKSRHQALDELLPADELEALRSGIGRRPKA